MPDDRKHPPVQDVVLNTEPVELYKILKFEALAASGGEAKQMIDEGLVRVNGEPESRRRREILFEDIIDCDGVQLRMIRADAG